MKITYIVIGLYIPLYGMQPININGNSTHNNSYGNINNSTFKYAINGNGQANIFAKNISNSSINVSSMSGNSTLKLSWWYGNPPQVIVHNQNGNASIYIGYSKLFYYTSCFAALGIGMYIGSKYFR